MSGANVITWRVDGIPKAQPRPRAFARKMNGTIVARVYESGTAEAWKGDVVRDGRPLRPATPIDAPVRFDAVFYLPRPKRLMRKKDPEGPVVATCRPDRDNLEKAVLDALTADGWLRDDCLVVAGEVRKFYHGKAGRPGANFRLTWPVEADGDDL